MNYFLNALIIVPLKTSEQDRIHYEFVVPPWKSWLGLKKSLI